MNSFLRLVGCVSTLLVLMLFSFSGSVSSSTTISRLNVSGQPNNLGSTVQITNADLIIRSDEGRFAIETRDGLPISYPAYQGARAWLKTTSRDYTDLKIDKKMQL